MKFGVVVVPGSNCDPDAFFAVEHTTLPRVSKPFAFAGSRSRYRRMIFSIR